MKLNTHSDNKSNPPSIKLLFEKNKQFARHYKKNAIMQLVLSKNMEKKIIRDRLLDCIQVFSDYFQKTVMLRSVFCSNLRFIPIANQHLEEEFGHNWSLQKDRNNRAPIWDPILESTAAWFAWKMFTLDEDEKTVLIHLVLEASGNIFFQTIHPIMKKYGETDYFKIHAIADEKHEKMGANLLKNGPKEKLERLLLIQQQGWDVLNTVCERMAVLTQTASKK